jgi:3-methyladenine DNA glycosylase AlkC
MSEIPADILSGLNDGQLETITLVECLAIDYCHLLQRVLPQVGLDKETAPLCAAAKPIASEGIMKRLHGFGALLQAELNQHPRGAKIFEALASHSSDTVRSWAAAAIGKDQTLNLKDRLAIMRRFAADSHMGVREIAWVSFRPFIAADLKRGIKLLEKWVADSDENVRRCAIESTRPRGVWCQHIDELKKDPQPGLILLEPVRADTSRYVQRSVANWLNDASKSQPAWTQAVCKRWLKESKSSHTAYIVNHALRTLRKVK